MPASGNDNRLKRVGIFDLVRVWGQPFEHLFQARRGVANKPHLPVMEMAFS